MTARQVTARIDRAGWPTVIRPLVTACPPARGLDRPVEKGSTSATQSDHPKNPRHHWKVQCGKTTEGEVDHGSAGKSQLIVYNHMWNRDPNAEWQCGGCTSFTSEFTRLDFLDNYDARFVIVTPGPIDAALAYAERVGNKMTWYSTSDSPFGADVDAPLGGGFGINVFLRDGETVYRSWHTSGRGVEQLTFTFALADALPYGRQEQWQDSPAGWPKAPTYSPWLDSPDIARLYGSQK